MIIGSGTNMNLYEEAELLRGFSQERMMRSIASSLVDPIKKIMGGKV